MLSSPAQGGIYIIFWLFTCTHCVFSLRAHVRPLTHPPSSHTYTHTHTYTHISHSGFRVLGLPHVYKLSESDSVREYFTSGGPLYDKSFGGASVTIPHKETIIPYLSHVHGAARYV